MIGTQTFKPGRSTVRTRSHLSRRMKCYLTHKYSVSFLRATCEQEPNYLQTFTSLSRWSQKADSQTASQYSILTMRALAQ